MSTSDRGFASMSREKQRAIASKGGKAAHAKGTAHEWDTAEARVAGRKGGQVSRGGRGRVSEGTGTIDGENVAPGPCERFLGPLGGRCQ